MVVQLITLSLPTRVEVELGCDNFRGVTGTYEIKNRGLSAIAAVKLRYQMKQIQTVGTTSLLQQYQTDVQLRTVSRTVLGCQ